MPTRRLPGAEPAAIAGRGAASNAEGRFERLRREAVDDGWTADDGAERAPQTQVSIEHARSALTRNTSPDLPFSVGLNPYRGCEHGCIYCYARPSHAYLGHSPGLDFETRLYAKLNIIDCLRRELARPGYQPEPIALGSNTDPYQPIEREYRLTRQILQLMLDCGHPLTLITKGSALLVRDLDLLQALAQRKLLGVGLSLTSLDDGLKRILEPRTSSMRSRLTIIRKLVDRGIPVRVLVAPVIPAVNDAELERILSAAAAAGAQAASYSLLRLPHELAPLFRQWLELHMPLRAAHVMSLIQQSRGGRDYQADFASRMTGQGVFATLLARRFELACRRLSLRTEPHFALDVAQFCPPRGGPSAQLSLF